MNVDFSNVSADMLELFNAISKYKIITSIIEKHIRRENNIFGELIKIFGEYYQSKYSPTIVHVKTDVISKKEAKLIISKAVVDVQQFIRLLFESITAYYKLENIKTTSVPGRENVFNRDNILNFITSIVLDGQIYDVLFDLLKAEDQTLEENYKKNLRICRKLKPQDFGVPDQYCLNELTIEYLQNKGIIPEGYKYIESAYNKEIDIIAENQEGNDPNLKEEYKENSSPLKVLTGKPYEKAIEILKNLSYRKSPIHKLKTIVKVAELVPLTINDFYQELGQKQNKKLDADQTLSIFMYIVAQSQVTDISTHCKIIEKFSTNNVLNSVSGYYATTLEACVNCLCSMSLREELNLNEVKSTVMKSVLQNHSLIGETSNSRISIGDNSMKSNTIDLSK